MRTEFQLLDLVHEDQVAVLRRGRCEATGEAVLLRILKAAYPTPQQVARFLHERDVTHELRAEGALVPTEAASVGDHVALVFPDFTGEPLDALLHRRVPPWAEALKVGLSLARTLARIHAQGLVHAAVRPCNILVAEPALEARLCGFGRAFRAAAEGMSGPVSPVLDADLPHVSPEQTGRLNRRVDWRTDLYSLGTCLHELLTGQPLFGTTDRLELLHGHLARMPQAPHEMVPAIPEVVSAIVLRLLAKAPEQRYQTAAGLAADLERCLAQLDETGRVQPFALGSDDISDRFEIPTALFGRERELEVVQACLGRVARGRSEVAILAGRAGVGKSAFADALEAAALGTGGRFLAARCDSQQREPFGPFIAAFGTLAKQVLASSEGELQEWRTRLRNALGSNAQVIVSLIPEIGLIVGAQPEPAALPPGEAQRRFNFALQSFVRALASPGQPLVLFLDDLQWADAASLKLLALLVTSSAVRNLLVIGTVSLGEDMDPAPALAETLGAVEAAGTPVTRLELPPLSAEAIAAFLSSALGRPLEQVAALAEVMHRKTSGTPLFLVQFVEALHQSGLLAFDAAQRRWAWSLPRIEAAGITDNVAELMARKMETLPAETRRLVNVASCVGSTFDARTLARIEKTSEAEVLRALRPAVREGLLVALEDPFHVLQDEEEAVRLPAAARQDLDATLRFAHDRVRQAAAALVGDEASKALHLRLGRLLLAELGEDAGERVFDIAAHLNLARDLLDDAEERVRAARVNLLASRRAAASAAHEAALHHSTLGLELLPAGAWESRYELARDLHLARGEGALLTGDLRLSEECFDAALRHVRSDLERATIWGRKVVLYTTLGRKDDGFEAGMTGLRLLGLRLPRNPGKLHVLRALLGTRWRLRGRGNDELLALQAVTDPAPRLTLDLLNDFQYFAYERSEELAAIAILSMIDVTLSHGTAPGSAFAFGEYGFLVASALKDAPAGRAYGELSLALAQRFDDVRMRGRTKFIMGCLVNHWTAPARTNVPYLREAMADSLASGDLLYASYALTQLAELAVLTGRPLDGVVADCDEYLAQARQYQHEGSVHLIATSQRLALNLMGLTRDTSSFGDESFDEQDFVRRIDASGFPTAAAWYRIAKLQSLYLFGRHEEALAVAQEAERLYHAVMGQAIEAELCLHQALVIAAAAPGGARAAARRLRPHRRRLARWAASCPQNYRHAELLVEAEAARLEGRDLEAQRLYDAAIDAAQAAEYPHRVALASELAARFHLGRGQRRVARTYVLQAHQAYRTWGAAAKTRQLEAEFPQLLVPALLGEGEWAGQSPEPISAAGTWAELDMETVMKASQAIASELELPNLLDKLLRIVVESAGAVRGLVIQPADAGLVVDAEWTSGQAAVSVLQAVPLDEREDVPSAIVQYVARTRRHVRLDDATQQGPFTRDPQVLQLAPKSVLCLPLLHQGGLTGVLYLENNEADGAFPERTLELLQMLSSQVASSLRNARLYAELAEASTQLEASHRALEGYSRSLEEKVDERTRELTQASQRVQALADDLAASNQFIRRTFGRYLDDEIVASLLESPEALQLGGESRKVTILMTDLRGFTALSNRCSPQQIVSLLNNYLGTMADVILKHHGMIDEFIGDAILAVFGVPVAREDDAERAVACAVDMQLAAAGVTERNHAAGLPPIAMAVAVNTGEVVVGNIGSQRRTKYGIVGSPINATARIESFTHGGQILVAEATLRDVRSPVETGPGVSIDAKGLDRPITVHELWGIGGRYQLHLPRSVETFVAIDPPIPVQLSVLDGKRATGRTYPGELVRLSELSGVLSTELPLAHRADLRMQLQVAGDVAPGDLYGRIEGAPAGSRDGVVVRFTSVPPDAARFLDDRRATAAS